MEVTRAKYRTNLPQLSNDIFITDGGCETTLIFHDNLELPEFASFTLLKDQSGCESLLKYYTAYAALANKYEVGVILESVGWRANPDWGMKLGYSLSDLAEADRQSIKLLDEIREKYETAKTPVVISGCLGPRGDGYQPTSRMTTQEAQEYHFSQIKTLSETSADLITAMTINYVEEAIGIVKAAQAVNMSVVISFTVETDGDLPSGQTLKDAIEEVDKETGNGPIYYMINCAHPTHFKKVVGSGEEWVKRIKGVRANASAKSHAELNECETLDEGNPAELGQEYYELLRKLKNVNVVGGCCGTDVRHVEEVCKSSLETRAE